MSFDVLVIGAGIVGVATARQLLLTRPGSRVLLIDKEAAPGLHQTGHNSGVIHAGVYYPPGSLKARLCREGARATREFCEQQGIAIDPCGKLIVATREQELAGLQQLQERCRLNDLPTQYLDREGLEALEPRLRGLAAIRVSETAVVDFAEVCRALLQDFIDLGGEVQFETEVLSIEEHDAGVRVTTSLGEIRSRQLIACAGLMADRLARISGLPCPYRIIPFRGEFYRLHPRCSDWFAHLVYPVPDPALPFLGVHLTRTLDGGLIAGPNALLGFAREAYRRSDINLRDVMDMLSFPGFWRLLGRHLRAGWTELLSAVSKRHYLRLLRRYCPDLVLSDLQPHPAGVRAQAVSRSGELVQDFLFLRSEKMLHVVNAPSPAATSALPIARHIVEQLNVLVEPATDSKRQKNP